MQQPLNVSQHKNVANMDRGVSKQFLMRDMQTTLASTTDEKSFERAKHAHYPVELKELRDEQTFKLNVVPCQNKAETCLCRNQIVSTWHFATMIVCMLIQLSQQRTQSSMTRNKITAFWGITNHISRSPYKPNVVKRKLRNKR